MDAFRKEARELPTADLLLILEDQVDLYSEEELQILREELASRPKNAFEIEEEERLEKERKAAEEAHWAKLERQFKQDAKARQNRIDSLKSKGYEGYYEYKVLSLCDEENGNISITRLAVLLNDYAMDGWRLVTSYANELGHNSSSFGGQGTNSTIDEHILIMERFVKI
jgi:hypothetical protein